MASINHRVIKAMLMQLEYRELQGLAKKLKRKAAINSKASQEALCDALCQPKVTDLLEVGEDGDVVVRECDHSRGGGSSSGAGEPDKKVELMKFNHEITSYFKIHSAS